MRGPVSGEQAQMKLTPTKLAEQTRRGFPYKKGGKKGGTESVCVAFAGDERLKLPPKGRKALQGVSGNHVRAGCWVAAVS